MRRVVYPFDELTDCTTKTETVYRRLTEFISDASLNKEYRVGKKLEVPLSKIIPCVLDCCSSIDELELVYF